MKRNFYYLATLTLLAVLTAVFLVRSGGSPQPASGGDLLLPEIAGQINAVDHVEIVAAGNRTVATLDRVGDYWQVEQVHGYRADWPRLRTLLAALAQATVVEAKTDKPQYYARLGVEDISAEDAGGVLVRLGIEGQTTGVLVGKQAQGRTGQYARLADSPASVLLDREVDVPSGEMDWVESEIIDIDSSEVAEVEIIHPGGERVLVTKVSAEQTDFDLVDIPEGREIKGSWVLGSLGSALSMLDMEAVRPEGDVDWSEAVRMRLLTFAGVEFMVEMLEQDEQYLLRLNASHPAAAVVTNQAEGEERESAQQEIEQQAMHEVTQAVEAINKWTAGWVYTIAKYKYEAMTKKPEDLLKPLEST